jgi:hypothetical protein
VKYKNIDSAIHNLGHSFMSGTNYVDDDHVMYEVQALARQPPNEVWINFSTGEVRPEVESSSRLAKAVALYRNALPDHLRKHQVDPGAIRDITLHHRLTRTGGETAMVACDDRGVEHHVIVRATA